MAQKHRIKNHTYHVASAPHRDHIDGRLFPAGQLCAHLCLWNHLVKCVFKPESFLVVWNGHFVVLLCVAPQCLYEHSFPTQLTLCANHLMQFIVICFENNRLQEQTSLILYYSFVVFVCLSSKVPSLSSLSGKYWFQHRQYFPKHYPSLVFRCLLGGFFSLALTRALYTTMLTWSPHKLLLIPRPQRQTNIGLNCFSIISTTHRATHTKFIICTHVPHLIGAVHILRQPPEGGGRGYGKCWRLLTKGGGGVSQMPTIVDPKNDNCRRGGLGLQFCFTNGF